MRKMWSNGYVSVLIEVKPLVNANQEEGFISQELYGMLDENEKRALQGSYDSYEYMVASATKTQNDQWSPGSTISNYSVDRQLDNVRRDKERVEEMVKGLQAKYGMEPAVR